MKLLILGSLFLSINAFPADKVVLDCTNSRNELRSIAISESDYSFLMFGNNHLEGETIRLVKTMREKRISLIDKLDNNIETGVYRCEIRN